MYTSASLTESSRGSQNKAFESFILFSHLISNKHREDCSASGLGLPCNHAQNVSAFERHVHTRNSTRIFVTIELGGHKNRTPGSQFNSEKHTRASASIYSRMTLSHGESGFRFGTCVKAFLDMTNTTRVLLQIALQKPDSQLSPERRHSRSQKTFSFLDVPLAKTTSSP
jgi:hypothetical protein